MKRGLIEVKAGIAVNGDTGMIMQNMPYCMASETIYRACRNDSITVNDGAFLLNVATYGKEVPPDYMYTYMYEPEQNWSCYTHDFDEDGYSAVDYLFQEDCYFRVCLKREDGGECTAGDAARAREILSFYTAFEEEERGDWFEQEILKTADTVCERMGEEKSLVFALLTDSHRTVNGTWKDTVENIAAVHKMVGFDGIIHLGDLQDGMLDKRMCRRIVSECVMDLRRICEPVYLAIGNHDTNYFKGNPQWLTQEEQYGIYGRFQDRYVNREDTDGWYYVDYGHVKLRMIFLTSFDHRQKVRYGFPEREVRWLSQTLDETPEGYRVLVFSHDAPLARLDYWADEIRNGEMLTQVLERYHRKPGKKILGYIHGHTHADFVYEEREFPIISVGCAKCEYFPDKKPEGSMRYMRKLKDVTQDLWDVLIITPGEGRLDFVRFGAGEDRTVKSSTKIWAHRGASGYAPENTLEAFLMAAQMGADGVELDVQLSKDGEIVVIHDEWIDRVSDGKGKVADYTLEELKRFNVNKPRPEYAKVCRIPTLREVLEALKDTGLTVNIELKTGVNFYEGIERKTVELVRETGFENRVLYSSFNHHSVLKIREYEPQARLAFLYSHELSRVAEYAKSNGVHGVNPSVRGTLFEEEMRECIRNNIEINVWTVNKREDMERLIRMGVNALITNYPDEARRALEG